MPPAWVLHAHRPARGINLLSPPSCAACSAAGERHNNSLHSCSPYQTLCLHQPCPPAAARRPGCRAVDTVLALEQHVQRLFLLVLASDLPPGLGEADVINGLALLSVLINASYGGWHRWWLAGCPAGGPARIPQAQRASGSSAA